MAGKSDVIVKLVLVFFISLLSFSVGTFVGKKYSDNQHQLAKLEPGEHGTHEVDTATENSHDSTEHGNEHATANNDKMSDEEIAKLGQEFVSDEEAPSAHGEKANDHGQVADAHGAEHGQENEHTNKKTKSHDNNKVAHHDEKPTSTKTPDQRAAIQPSAAAHEIAAGPAHSRATASLPPNDVATPGKFTLQVAAFPSEQEAQGKATELKNKGLGAFYIPALVNGKTWYRVSIGQFATQEEATEYRSNIIKEGKIASGMIQKIK